jgi:hypothetical protein
MILRFPEGRESDSFWACRRLPSLKPSGMDKATEPKPSPAGGEPRQKDSKTSKLTIHEERTVTLMTPPQGCFFENWRGSLKWQRLIIKPYEKFAEMMDRHWDGIAAYCQSENKVSLGFVEGLNNKIRVIQRRAYGLRNEEYLQLKILTCMLPAL